MAVTPRKKKAAPLEPSPGGRARLPRRRPTGAERRAQIIHEALRCFAERGFRGTTTRDVAERVGISEAALYRYFPSKEAMYDAILEEKIRTDEPLDALRRVAAARDDRAVFGELARWLLSSVESDPSFLRILLYAGLEGHSRAEPFFATRMRRLREFLSGYVAERSREGAFREVDPVLCAHAFMGMVSDHLIVREIFGQRAVYPHPSDQVVDAFVSIFLDGVRIPGDPVDG